MDNNSIRLDINIGVDTPETFAWMVMLGEMYKHWADNHEYRIRSYGRSRQHVSVVIEGPGVYDLLKGEAGIHRLVRVSPFDDKNRRHISFAAVSVNGEEFDARTTDWGDQMRSYVFDPYTMVKDHHTGYETDDIARIMDGDIDDLLKHNTGGEAKEAE